MPEIADLYSSKYLKPADLGGKPVTVTIDHVTVDAFQNDGDNVRKAVLHFRANDIKPLVINKTNYLILAHPFGKNTDAWIGKQIIVCPSMTPFKGKMVETIRVEPLRTPDAPQAGVPPAGVPPAGAPSAGAPSANAPLNDEIPKSW
jgi:hypothetical protein